MRIILLGPPGAGKGTHCKRVIQKYDVHHLSSGDILRQQRASRTELGKKAQTYMDSGQLVPDKIIIEMMVGEITKCRNSGYLLDGFPRTVPQAQALADALAAVGERIDLVLNLKIDDQTAASRLTGRRSCPGCGAVYHLENLKPKVNGACDHDGAELVQRPDDRREIVANRLRTYRELTAPVVDFYKKDGRIYDIDAGRNVDEVTKTIFEKLDTLGAS